MNVNKPPRLAPAGAVPPVRRSGTSQPQLEDPRIVGALEEYLAALESGEKPDRQEFLARHADIAAALAGCLDGMEALHGASPSHASPSGGVGGAGPALEWRPEAPLGDFRIVREIGRGGMGVVYEAVQLSLGRQVALKVLPFAAALNAKQLQRFKNEAQAAAHLHHTNIVPVFFVGAERGVHFYAMQLIEGQNLATLIEELRHHEGNDECRMTNDERSPKDETRITKLPHDTPFGLRHSSFDILSSFVIRHSTFVRLAVQAAAALDYAHGMGIIHRDVKPANLLLDARGNVWITDFGLAQFHADASLTHTGDLLGTLRYMSPEQAGGPRGLIDHRTDVYSLGATLYELLTLRPIFDGADRQTLLHQVLHEEPRPPRSINAAIPRELETIVLKATTKAPAERYATAAELADDLQRFLDDLPILARRATVVQRGRKWLRRHPAVPVAAVALLVLVALGSFFSAWLIRGAYQRERQRAEEAEQQFRLARSAVDEIIELAQDDLTDQPNAEGLRKRLLEVALSYYQTFIRQRREDRDTLEELKRTRDRVMSIVADLAVMQGAWQHLLLGNTSVQDDLQLFPGQRQRIRELLESIGQHPPKPFRGSPKRAGESPSQEMIEEVRAHEADIVSLLTPDQLRRLRQIALQVQGSAAFRETEVATALKLTAEQKARIRALEEETSFGRPERSRGGPSPGGRWEKPEPRDPPTGNRILQEVLTAEQRQRWQEMTGKEFQGEVRTGYHPMGRPGGRHGGPFGPPRGRPHGGAEPPGD